MKRLLLLIFSIAVGSQVYAQSDSLASASDSVILVPPTSAQFITPSITFDYGKSLVSLLGFEDKFEGALSLVFFERYYLIGELGLANLSPENATENGSYSAEGLYYRIGAGYQSAINPTSRLGLGARYSVSSFDDTYISQQSSPSGVQSEIVFSDSRRNLEARWVELVLHSESNLRLKKSEPESKLNRLFSVGFQLRLRFLASYNRFSPYDVYAVPGYGRTVNDPNLALNVYLKFNPFR